MSRTSASFALALLVLAWAVTAPVHAAEAWDEPFAAPAAELLAAARAVPDRGADSAVVLLEEGRYSFDAAGRVTREYRLVYRITSAEGVEDWSRVETGFAPFHQARPELKARVISPSGEEHWLDPATIADTPVGDDPDLYDDQRMLRAPLPRLSIGAVVEHRTITRDESAIFDAASMGVFFFGQSQPARTIRLILDAPATLPLTVSLKGLDGLVPTRTEADGRVKLVYERHDVPAWTRDAALLPPDALRWPHVAFTTGRSWNAVARRYAELVEKSIDTQAVAAMAKQAAEGLTDRRAIVAACVAALRSRLRYAGIEFGVAAIVPVPPEQSLRRGYGDCKDQAAFLVSMLRSLGIPAQIALIDPGPGGDIDEDLPGVAAFGHAIAHVPGEPPLWVDTTDPHTPVGELPDLDQGRLALLIDPATTGLTRTPSSTSKDNRVLERIEIRLSENGPATVREDAEAWGILAAEYRANYDGATSADIEATLRDYAEEMYLAEAIEGVTHSDGARLEPSYRISFTAPKAHRGFTDMRQAAAAMVTIPTYARLATLMDLATDDDEDLLVDSEPDEEAEDGADAAPSGEEAPQATPPPTSELPAAKEKAKEPAPPRDADWMIPEAFSWERRYHVVPPPGFQMRSVPEPITKRLGPASFTSEASVEEDGSVTVVHRFDTGGQRFTDAQWKTLHAGLDELAKAKPEIVVFDNVGELHLAEGRIREALAQFRVLAALHPSEALHRVQISRALLAAGLGAAARAEAERAALVEPTSPLAHRVLGFTCEHDALGRRFGTGADPEAALRHLRRAVELGPDDMLSRAELAYVLERDAEGELRWEGTRLAEAIAEYRALRALTPDKDDDARDEALLAALVRSRDWAAAKALAEDMPQSQSRDATILVCVAAAEGAQPALARSLKPPFEASERPELLRTVAARLTQSRLYPEAVAFFEEAAKGTSRIADLHESIDLFRRVKPYEQVLLPSSDPASVVQQMEVVAIEEGVEAQMALLGRELRDSDEEREAILEDFSSSRLGRGRRGSLAPEFRLDVVLSTQQLVKDGDDTNGWRVRVRRSDDGDDETDDVYVIREDGAWRIVATASQPQHLGRQALNRLDAGDLVGARRWLDWAREHLRSGDADDPVWLDVFPRAWRKGQEGSEAQVRLAAAILVARTGDRDRAIPTLRAARAASDVTPQQAVDLDVALVSTYFSRDRNSLSEADRAELLRLTRSIAAAEPASPTALNLLAESLQRSQAWDELEAEVRHRLEASPGDPDLDRALADTLAMKGRIADAQAIFRSLVDRGDGRASDFNMLAWLALFTGSSLDKALEDAQRAAQMSRGENPAYLHTLASVLAESGRASAARELVLRTLDAGRRSEPEPSDWYVLGRIAEEYGEREAALDAYGRVELTDDDAALPHLSCHRLAERRIMGLTATAR